MYLMSCKSFASLPLYPSSATPFTVSVRRHHTCMYVQSIGMGELFVLFLHPANIVCDDQANISSTQATCCSDVR